METSTKLLLLGGAAVAGYLLFFRGQASAAPAGLVAAPGGAPGALPASPQFVPQAATQSVIPLPPLPLTLQQADARTNQQAAASSNAQVAAAMLSTPQQIEMMENAAGLPMQQMDQIAVSAGTTVQNMLTVALDAQQGTDPNVVAAGVAQIIAAMK